MVCGVTIHPLQQTGAAWARKLEPKGRLPRLLSLSLASNRSRCEKPMAREVRYQAAVIVDDRLLLLRCQPHDGPAFWLLPGGGREDGESEQSCVEREVREETTLSVVVGAVLDDAPADPPDGTYTRWRTYACQVIGGEATPGGAE